MVSGRATPFGVPVKTGVGFTTQEADHREWSLSMCRTWCLGSALLLAPHCMHVGRGFSGKERGTGLLSFLPGTSSWARLCHVLEAFSLVFCQALPDVTVYLKAPLRVLGCLHMTWKWREFPPNSGCMDKGSFLECFISQYSIFWDA